MSEAKQHQIHCDDSPKELWEKCLVLHSVYHRGPLDPICALVILTGCTHEESQAAHQEMHRLALLAGDLEKEPSVQ